MGVATATMSPNKPTKDASRSKNTSHSSRSVKENALPISRIRTIMKSANESVLIKEDVLIAMSRATELFISLLARKAHSLHQQNNVEYKDLAEIVQTDSRFEFLQQIVPRKITVKEFREIIAKKANDSSELSDSDEESSSSDDENE